VKRANFPEVVTAAVSKGVAAYEQLMEKAERLRKSEPGLTSAQAFTKVYTDPANIALAQQERNEARPASGANTSYPMP
jgi:hypothetical protein